jgi:hypothetical protein
MFPWSVTPDRSRLARAVVFAVCLIGHAGTVCAQEGVEIMPFGGYRFGGDFFEIVTEQPLDLDGAPALGFVVNVPLWTGLQVEAMFTRERAEVTTLSGPLGAATRWDITVDHYQGGALQELDGGRVRPFLTGLMGLTRYAAAGDNEIRFTLGGGGGIKLFPLPHLGVRLDGKAFATFAYVDAQFTACSSGAGCFVAIRTDVVWQAEFSVGLIVRFP